MAALWEWISNSISRFSVLDMVDISIITVLIYTLLTFTRETRAIQLLRAAGIIFVAARLSEWMQLTAISWVLNAAINTGALLAVVIFQPEIRRGMEHLGRGRFIRRSGLVENAQHRGGREALTRVLGVLSRRRVGALIVMEQNTLLGEVLESGTIMDAVLSAELIENIFEPNTPLHDGAVVIRNRRIFAAGCFLPLTQNIELGHELGTRHRAALGVTEVSDALVLVVSEETGIISAALDGKLIRNLDEAKLNQLLEPIFSDEQTQRNNIWKMLTQWRTRNGRKQSKNQ